MFTCFDLVIKTLTKEMIEKLQYKDSHYSTILNQAKEKQRKLNRNGPKC